MQTNRYKVKSLKSFNQQAWQYDRSTNGAHARQLYPYVLEQVRSFPGHALLDVGCGTGAMLHNLKGTTPCALAGLDLSPEMIAVARQKLGDQVDLRIGDAEALPWADTSFDLVLCINSFHHYPAPATALDEIKRILTRQGQLFLADLYFPTPIRQIANLFLPFLKAGDVRMYSRQEICTLLERAGFTAIQWRRVPGSVFVVTAKSESI